MFCAHILIVFPPDSVMLGNYYIRFISVLFMYIIMYLFSIFVCVAMVLFEKNSCVRERYLMNSYQPIFMYIIWMRKWNRSLWRYFGVAYDHHWTSSADMLMMFMWWSCLIDSTAVVVLSEQLPAALRIAGAISAKKQFDIDMAYR